MKIEDLQSIVEANVMKVVEKRTEKQEEQALLAKFKKLETNKERWKNNKGTNPIKRKIKKGDDKPETSTKNGGGHVKNQNKKKAFDINRVKCYNREKMRHYTD